MGTRKITTYAESGVDRAKADRLVDFISKHVPSTHALIGKGRVERSIGGYASLVKLSKDRWIAATTDGVGTKLKLAFELNQHSTIGQDLVAMSVNDLLCVGARPLFFLDYFATGKLRSGVAQEVLRGIIAGCEQAGCALVGGETAEMPGVYATGEYDLAGFAVGVLEKRHRLPLRKPKPGDVLIGVASSGFHSNGFSLLRAWLPRSGSARRKLMESWLEPTRIYIREVAPLIEAGKIVSCAHITGSGFLNIPRMSQEVSYALKMPRVSERAHAFQWLYQQLGNKTGMKSAELFQTFNMGLGLVMCVEARNATSVLLALKKSKIKSWNVGRVVSRGKGRPCQVIVEDSTGTSFSLRY